MLFRKNSDSQPITANSYMSMNRDSNPTSPPPVIRIGDKIPPVEESTKFIGLWWDLHLPFRKHTIVLTTQCKCPQSHPNCYILEVQRAHTWSGEGTKAPIPGPQSQIVSRTTDYLLPYDIVVRNWSLTICSLCVQCCERKFVMNITELTHLQLPLGRFPRLTLWNF